MFNHIFHVIHIKAYYVKVEQALKKTLLVTHNVNKFFKIIENLNSLISIGQV